MRRSADYVGLKCDHRFAVEITESESRASLDAACTDGTMVSLDNMRAPIASSKRPVGMRDDLPVFFIAELESNSVRNASYLSFNSVT